MTEKKDEELFCENCGSRLSVNAEFCDECGCKIDHLQSSQQTTKSGKYFAFIGMASLVVVVLGAVCVMNYGNGRQPIPVNQGEQKEPNEGIPSQLPATATAVTADPEVKETEAPPSNTNSSFSDTGTEGQADAEDADFSVIDADDLEDVQEDVGDIGEDEDIYPEDEYIFPNSDSEYLKKSDIKGMSAEEINFAKNELYARHGRIFKRKELQEYFESCSWYTPLYTAGEWDKYGDSIFFNKYEIKNRNFLAKWESKKR